MPPLAWVNLPLWMAFSQPSAAPDHSEARAYPAAKAASADGQAAQPPATEAELMAEAAAMGELIAEAVLGELARRASHPVIATERPRCCPAVPAHQRHSRPV